MGLVNQETNIHSTEVLCAESHRRTCARLVRLVTTTPECIQHKFNLSSLYEESQPDFMGDRLWQINVR